MTVTALQCPTCGHVHPLREVPREGRFRCAGCNRLLSVPAGMEPRPDPDATQAHPAPTPSRRSAGAAPLPAWVRAPVWVIALGLGFVVAAGVLRMVGLLDMDTVLDAFAGEGLGRYAVLLVLVPLWAVVSAGAAHLVLEWVARRRPGHGHGETAGTAEKPHSRRDERPRRAV